MFISKGVDYFLMSLNITPPWHPLFPNACNVLLRSKCPRRTEKQLEVHTEMCMLFLQLFKMFYWLYQIFMRFILDEEVVFCRDQNYLSSTFSLLPSFLTGQHSPGHPFRTISSGMVLQFSWRWITTRDQIWIMQYYIHGCIFLSQTLLSGLMACWRTLPWASIF